MIFITILLKRNFNTELLFTDTDSVIYKIKSEKFMKNFSNGKICLTLVITQKIQSFLMRLIKKLLVK